MKNFDNSVGLLLFAAGTLAGIALVAMLPGMPWSAGQLVLDLPTPTDQHDLAAQRSMAAAAWYMVVVTAIAAVIGAATLYLVFRTLLAAQRSAEAAELAIKNADTNAGKAAELARAQYRAYMAVTEVTFEGDGYDNANFGFSWKVANTGQSPSDQVRLTITLDAYARESGPWNRCDTHTFVRFLAAFPANAQKPDDQWFCFNIDEAERNAWDKAPRIEVHGTIDYLDIFGDWQGDVFAFRSTFDQNEVDHWVDQTEMHRRPEPAKDRVSLPPAAPD